MSTIALDFDGTYTADPLFWNQFIFDAQMRGHVVMIVTLRNAELDSGGMLDHFRGVDIPIIFCDGQSKRKVAEERGLKFDIWIDDMPESITNGSPLSPVELKQWREEQKNSPVA